MKPGERLGPYEILAPIGKGGMGEVWKARDTRLGRDVAIKISAEQFSERFEREARAIAALNHPNICHLYDVGPNYLVMELIEGTSLKGPLPLQKAIEYSGQILDALDAAHRKSITHRDLKPANILVTKQGIKLLDFGLAKVAGPLKETDSTLTQALTSNGQIVGTLQYMSPEQLQGGEADARSDLFAFGCVLYEMLTGKRAFDGASAASVIAAILERSAPSVAAVAPPLLDQVVKRCLAKDPDQRWQSAKDVKAVLECAVSGMPEAASPNRISPKSKFATSGWIAAALLVVALIGVSWIAYRHATEAPPQVVKMSIPAPAGMAIYPFDAPAFSPDGRHIAFVAVEGDKRQLWVRDMDSLEARSLSGTDGASTPFWSPDSRYLAFFAGGKLAKMDVGGGLAVTLCDLGASSLNVRGASWSKKNVIIFTPNLTAPLFQVPASGGKPEPITTLDTKLGEVSHRFPWFLPDGRHFLYTAATGGLESGVIYVGDLEGSARKRLMEARSNIAFARPGYILFAREQVLFAQPMKAETGELSGEPVPIAAPVEFTPITIGSKFSVSENGALVYLPAGAIDAPLIWVKRDGTQIGALGAVGDRPAISPDESTVAFERGDSQTGLSDIWMLKIVSAQTTRFTFNGRTNTNPVWSPDGRRIVYRSVTGANGNGLRWKGLDGSFPEAELDVGDRSIAATDWTSDGRYIVENSTRSNTFTEIWLVPLFEHAKPRAFLQARFSQGGGTVSPDGRLIAYSSNETGRNEIYVQTFPTATGKRQVSTDGGSRVRWSRNGNELLFIGTGDKMMAAAVTKGPNLELGPPKPLFSVRIGAASNFDVSKDGRFLIPVEGEQSALPPISVVLNWQAGSKK